LGILEGKIAVITGGTRGLGLAIAKAFVNAGAAAVVSSRSQKSVEETVTALNNAGGRAAGIACDVSELDQVQALVEHTIQSPGHFDIWINNAGISAPYGVTAAISPVDFTRVIQTNLMGTYHGSLAAIRHFLARGSGKLINMLGRGDREPAPFQNAYGSSKTWVRTFTMALANETTNSGIGVYAFNPGMMDTEMLYDIKAIAGYEGRMKQLPVVMRMFSRPPDEPAQRLVWLASSATDGRTGLDISQLSRSKLIGGVLREGLRIMLHCPAKPIEIKVNTVPSDLLKGTSV
jgi:NAD(P)-dependent dehydrogenase (short-subunit alcohol dehydrogenase family)